MVSSDFLYGIGCGACFGILIGVALTLGMLLVADMRKKGDPSC